ncbi:MAG: PEP-CTERM sorting domain-containing protein [Dehalococcoidia bacterium]
MMRSFLLAGVAVIGLAAQASAAPLTLTGNYVQVGVNDNGTLGSGGATPPGMLHDPTGTGSFAPGGIPNDYLTPGSPHEGFAVKYATSPTSGRTQLLNDNQGPADFGTAAPTPIVDGATWTSSVAGVLQITNTYKVTANSERVVISTTITALAALLDVVFGRSVDPDPDVNRFGDFVTVNQRGNATLSANDFVGSKGNVSGLFLALLNLSGNTYAHDTGISGFCCNNDDPDNVLAGYGATFPGTSTGDEGLQMAWRLGDMAEGTSKTIDYAYVFGAKIDDVIVDERVPVPATAVLFGAALLGLAGLRRKAA